MKQRILFANIGWMAHYKGNTDNDMIVGGGSYTPKDKHDVFNFMELNGKCYGYVQVKGQMNLGKIDSDYQNENSIDDVLVVWVARNKNRGGRFIVGWYNHATVYSNYVVANQKERNNYNYNIVADYKNCTLVPVDSRTFKIPKGKGYFGQAQTWYAKGKTDDEENELSAFRNKVLNYINHYDDVTVKKHKAFKIDADAKKKIEKSAITFVQKHYKDLGYEIKDVQKQNVGWDLEARIGKQILKLEVKGLGGSAIDVLISQNEYDKMRLAENKKTYRLCVVTEALTNPNLYIFNHYGKEWIAEDDSNLILDFKPRTYQATLKEEKENGRDK